ncbi:diacylglycerol kinase family protein [Leuconostocaceae bacterium ESL0723]|nr:diacylglycerol kinase family protein [Lactobacillaceae bacterium L1_55_11]WEV55134.1 diacylglycerol kinase family protein [Leuconostocaceae bacterium ESL0723]
MDSKDKDQGQTETHQVTRNRTFWRASYNALHGVWSVLVRERNMRIHIVIAFVVLLAGLHFGLNRADWLWVTIGVFLAIYSEFLNTIIESVVDLIVGDRYEPLAGLAKDVAAGLVLVAVGFELIILLIIFQPYIWRELGIVTHFSEYFHHFRGLIL